MDEETIEYYDHNSEAYGQRAYAIDMSFLLRRFMALLPRGAKILDLGCGPGRDLKIFSDAGFDAIGIEYSKKMVDMARRHSPASRVEQGDMRNLTLPTASVDGVWCCASLLHFNREESLTSTKEIARVARGGAVILISVKRGTGSYRARDGRLFVLFSEESLTELLQIVGLTPYMLEGNRGVNGEEWLTALVRKPPANSGNTPLTVEAALAWGRMYLKGFENSTLESQELLQYVLKDDKTALYRDPEVVLKVEEDRHFFSLLERRKKHEPLAYLLGRQGFMSLEFRVTPAVLIPRPETELLVEYALRWFKELPFLGLDLGTGSGCIAVSLLKYHPQARMVAVDISPEALLIAEENACTHGVKERMEILSGDLFAPLTKGPEFDLIVSNPPYISEEQYAQIMPEVRYEPALALRAGDGLDFYRRIFKEAPSYLKPGGLLLLELGYGQPGRVLSLVPPELEIKEVLCDYAQIERVIALGAAKK